MYITIYLWPYKEKNSYKSNRYVTDMDTSSHGSRLNKGVASCATWSQSAVHERHVLSSRRHLSSFMGDPRIIINQPGLL